MQRREFMVGALGVLGAGLPAFARALDHSRSRFLFVFAQGGWDPLTVFAPLYGSASVDMEVGSGESRIGAFSIVDSLARPSVRAFFEQHGARTVLLNGISVRSVSHETCTTIALTGSTAGDAADWATHLAAAQGGSFALPHLVLAGPSLPGDHSVVVARTGASGQLQGLLGGGLLDAADVRPGRPSPVAERILDRYLERRTSAFAAAAGTGAAHDLGAALHASQQRAAALKGERFDVDFNPGGTLASQADVAAQALASGLSRCVSLSPLVSFDTHADNRLQSGLFEQLFAGLLHVLQLLETRRDADGNALAETVTVVVLSEMGRTPKLNATGGRDHWPYTSALVIGAGVRGGTTVGAYDERFVGRGVDPRTGESSGAAPALGMGTLGATLLALGGVDPGGVVRDAGPLESVLA